MKIKCIYNSHEECKIKYDEDGLYKHLREFHLSGDRDSYLVWLLFKIHEKIAECYNPQGILCPSAMDELDLLKSLLEDEK